MTAARIALADLPAQPPGRTGWPWTEASPPVDGDWPPVSVVTPSFNQAPYIEETIRSVLLQGYPRLEYIVVDGGSSDGTLEILRRYEPWLRWISEPDRGQTDAINKGLRLASGQILAYLNSDDIFLPGGVQAIVECFARQPAAGLAYGVCRVIDEAGRGLGALPDHPFDLRRTIDRGEFLPQQAVFWRRAAMDTVGLFDDTLHFAMDYEYFIRIARAMPVAHTTRPVAAFRMQSSSKTVAQAEKHWREALAVSERYGLRPWRPWYWIRRARHYGLQALPAPLERLLRRRLARPQDPRLYREQA